ncbi:MAG: hypothetical protein ACK4ON_06405 [Bacteroidia bacterium]
MLAIISIVVLSACRRQGPAKGIVTVVDKNNKPVYNATVNLHARDIPAPSKPGEIEATQTTDASGKAAFEFANDAIFTIDAYIVETVNDSILGTYQDTIRGTSSIRLEKDKTVEETVVIR